MKAPLRLDRRGLWVALATVLIGPLPVALLSARGNAFLPSAPVDVPYMTVPMVTLGHFLVLPFFNAYLFTLAWEIRFHIRRAAATVALLAVVGALMSLITQYYYHVSWVGDGLTGFLDFETGTLAASGSWHLAFSVVQSTAIYLFGVFWILAYHARSRRGFQLGLSGWNFYLLFALIGLLNPMLLWISPAAVNPLNDLLKANALALAHVVLAIAVYLMALHRGRQEGLLGVPVALDESRGDHAIQWRG